MSINWSFFPVIINEYAKLGYTYIEVPWLVNEEAIKATIPSFAKPLAVDSGTEANQLVGSAEQSFLYMALKNELPSGKYMALTPCFRDDKVDELHQKYFMKLELIIIGKVYSSDVIHVMNDARYVLSQFSKKTMVVQPTDDGSDLTLNGIEIGSYGKREYKNIKWIYGTGLAEPRFSIANGI
jgi:tRNA synthetases class II core domain (F)